MFLGGGCSSLGFGPPPPILPGMISVECCDAGYSSTDVADYVWHEDDCPRLNELLGEAGEPGTYLPMPWKRGAHTL